MFEKINLDHFHDKNLELEVGSGNGDFLIHHTTNTKVFVIGTELKLNRCQKIAKKITNNKIDNQILVRSRAEDVLKSIPSNFLDAVHVYFPDPWTKSKHRRRRFLKKGNLDILASRLKPGGHLFFVTDFFDYFLQTKILCLSHPDLHLNLDLVVQAGKNAIFSRYRFRLIELGKSILALVATKNI